MCLRGLADAAGPQLFKEGGSNANGTEAAMQGAGVRGAGGAWKRVLCEACSAKAA